MFLNENLGHVTLIVEKHHLNYSKEYILVCLHITISFSLLGSHYQCITYKSVAFLTSGMFLLRGEKT